MRKISKIIIIATLTLITTFFTFGHFLNYGATQCTISYVVGNQIGSCDCFCCQGPFGAGYESCGIFGLFLGLVLGATLGIAIVNLPWKQLKNYITKTHHNKPCN